MNLTIKELRVDAVGPGSRGGHVIGQTTTGKAIYANHTHPAHKDFTAAEHLQAAHAHTLALHQHELGYGSTAIDRRSRLSSLMGHLKSAGSTWSSARTFKAPELKAS